MRLLHPRREPFSAHMENGKAVVENAYVRCVHDPGSGGGLSGAFIRNGSNENMFVLPQSFIVGITEHGVYHTYKACEGECRLSRNGDNPVVETKSIFRDPEGKLLEGLFLELRTEYTPWGEARFRAVFDARRRISDLGMVQVGTLYASDRMDTMAVQESLEQSGSPYMGNYVKRWEHLTPSPRGIYGSCHLPLSFLMFKRGVEGFQVSLGDDLTQWESVGGTLPGLQFGYAAFRARQKCYEIRFCPLDCRRDGQYLEGRRFFHRLPLRAGKDGSPFPLFGASFLQRPGLRAPLADGRGLRPAEGGRRHSDADPQRRGHLRQRHFLAGLRLSALSPG